MIVQPHEGACFLIRILSTKSLTTLAGYGATRKRKRRDRNLTVKLIRKSAVTVGVY